MDSPLFNLALVKALWLWFYFIVGTQHIDSSLVQVKTFSWCCNTIVLVCWYLSILDFSYRDIIFESFLLSSHFMRSRAGKKDFSYLIPKVYSLFTSFSEFYSNKLGIGSQIFRNYRSIFILQNFLMEIVFPLAIDIPASHGWSCVLKCFSMVD